MKCLFNWNLNSLLDFELDCNHHLNLSLLKSELLTFWFVGPNSLSLIRSQQSMDSLFKNLRKCKIFLKKFLNLLFVQIIYYYFLKCLYVFGWKSGGRIKIRALCAGLWNCRSQHPHGKPSWLLNGADDSLFRPSQEIIFPQFTNLQVSSL